MDKARLARECLEIERAGCSVREFLHSAGCISPWGTWFRIQKEELRRQPWQIKDGKGEEVMGKITLEQKKTAVEIAIAGKDPIPYLKDCGSDKPGVTWANIKRNLEATDPEAFRLLAENEKTEAEPEKPEIDLMIPSEELGKICAEELFVKQEPQFTAPVNYGGYDVTAIHDPDLGEFYHDRKFKCMDWRLEDGDEVSLSIGGWHQLIEKLPEIMEILGI